ncbi:MAG TPA: (2Fe-2S)-binding protein [Acidimicrobiales bacterium]
MYACLCEGVSERKVRAAIARGARTIDDLAEECGAGARCGGCWPMLDELIAECAPLNEQRERSSA